MAHLGGLHERARQFWAVDLAEAERVVDVLLLRGGDNSTITPQSYLLYHDPFNLECGAGQPPLSIAKDLAEVLNGF